MLGKAATVTAATMAQEPLADASEKIRTGFDTRVIAIVENS
jgi:hypothetical protein